MEKIRLRVSNKKAYIYDVKDVETLRVKHHICGLLSGTLPQIGQQNVFLGLPLILLPEEVVLLVKNNVAVLVDDSAAHQEPTEQQIKDYHGMRKETIEVEQLESWRVQEEKRERAREVYKEQIGKRRLEKEEKKNAKLQDSTTAARGDDTAVLELFVPDIPEGAKTTSPPEAAGAPHSSSSKSVSSIPYTINIRLSSTGVPWYDPSSSTYDDLDAARGADVWTYPSTPLQVSRCKVFEDLWKKGHYMGGGLRFGGDFLIYPGDPLRYHSHFTLTVLSSPESSIMPLDLVAYGRLATAVKKAHLLASWNEQTQKADYFSLEWAAFG